MKTARCAEIRHQIWSRLCDLADETASMVEIWWEIDPEMVDVHYRRNALRTSRYPYDEEEDNEEDKTGDEGQQAERRPYQRPWR